MTQTPQHNQQTATPYRVVVSASFTAEPMRPVLEYWGRVLGVDLEVRFAPYNQMAQTALDEAGEFAANRRGVNVVLVRTGDLGQGERVRENARALGEALRASAGRTTTPMIVGVTRGEVDAAAEAELRAGVAGTPGIYWLERADWERTYPVVEWRAEEGERLGRIPYTESYFAALATALVRRAQALSMAPYKAIAVDCDNTLWKGICGEDGPRGVVLDGPRRALQEFLLKQRDAGMVLTLASKNNAADVWETFEAHKEFPLRREHFATWRLDWASKAANVAAMAAELGVGVDSFVFIDDNPKEIAEVEDGAPDVLALVVPADLETLAPMLDHVWAFDRAVVTEEDRKRGAMVGQSLEFGRAAKRAASLEEFMATLELRVDFQPMAAERLGRVAQLTQRTNQFNTTTVRRTEGEVAALAGGAGWQCYTAEVSDRFGEYGLVGVLMAQARVTELYVDTFLLSCRALGRGVEHRMLAEVAERALDDGIYTVTVPLRVTAKNAPAREFLEGVGFGERIEEEGQIVFRFPATELQSLRWRPAAAAAALGESLAAPALPRPSRRRVDYGRIAVKLRTVAQIVAAVRADAVERGRAQAGAQAAQLETETERRLASIWSQLLERPVADGRANFFDLGGHSLLAVLLLMRVKEEFGVELSVDDVYSATLTLGELAGSIEAKQLGDIDPEEYQAMLAEIEGLTDDEVRALLEKEQGEGE